MTGPAHPLLVSPRHDTAAAERFCVSFMRKLEGQIRPSLRRTYERKWGDPTAGAKPPTPTQVAAAIKATPKGRCWYRMRTDNQDRMYRIARDIATERDAEIESAAARQPSTGGSLTLNPSLEIPAYISALDTHRMPGGYGDQKHDLVAGAMFDRSISVHAMGSQGTLNDDAGTSLMQMLTKKFPAFAPKRILDLGCTVGHNTIPLKTAFPTAEVHAIDVSASCLRYADARARALGAAIHFHQQSAEQLSFPDGHFDLVFSRILLHETSMKALPKIFAECFRVLSPRGIMLHSDAPQFDELDAYRASLRDWDATCNNEPFMLTLYTLPLEELYADAGFAKADTFRGFAPSTYFESQNLDPNETRSGGRYFYSGAQR